MAGNRRRFRDEREPPGREGPHEDKTRLVCRGVRWAGAACHGLRLGSGDRRRDRRGASTAPVVIYVDSRGAAGAKVAGDNGLYRFDATQGDRIPARGIATFIVLAPGYQTLVTKRDVEYDDNDVIRLGDTELRS